MPTRWLRFTREYGRIVFAQVLLVVGDRVIAEEILQDTMLAVWHGAGSFRGDSSVRSWVIAVARRRTRDRLRARRLRVVDDSFLADQPGSGPGPDVMALDRAELAEVRGAIRELAPDHREVLGLAFGSGLSLLRSRPRAGRPGRDGKEPPRRSAHRLEPDTSREGPEPMNADSADTRYPHLDLDDLIAGAAGQPVRDPAREHLASCEHCQHEANRWNLVADGVRGLVAGASEAPQPRWPQDAPQHVGRPWRRAILGGRRARQRRSSCSSGQAF